MMGLNVNIIAKSTLAILAVVVLFTMLSGIASNSAELIDTGKTLFTWVIIAVVLVTIIINLPRYRRF